MKVIRGKGEKAVIQKNRKLKCYTAEDIEKIVKMNDKGFKAKEIASIIGVSERSAATYIDIVDNLSSGLPISSDKHTYCESAVKEFCENHGIEYRHVSDGQKPEEAPEVSTNEQPKAGQEDGEDQKEFYRFNAKLPAECEEYLKEMAWRNRCTITEYLTRLVIADGKKETGDQLPGQMCVEDVMEFQPLPPAAGKRQESDNLRQARDEMSRAIARFIWEVVAYYMSAAE